MRLRGEMAEVERVAMALEKQLSASAKQARHDKDEFESHVTASMHTLQHTRCNVHVRHDKDESHVTAGMHTLQHPECQIP